MREKTGNIKALPTVIPAQAGIQRTAIRGVDTRCVIPAQAGIQCFGAIPKMDTRQNNSGMTNPPYFEQKELRDFLDSRLRGNDYRSNWSQLHTQITIL